MAFFGWPVGGDSPAQSLIKLVTKVIKIMPVFEVTLLVHPVVHIHSSLAKIALQSASTVDVEKNIHMMKIKTQLFTATTRRLIRKRSIPN